MDKTLVSITKCSSYNQASEAINNCLNQLGGLQHFVKPGQRVLLKVNLLFGKDPKYAISTHPAIVKAVIEEVIKAGAFPTVGDSPAISTIESAAGPSGIKTVCETTNTPLIELNNPKNIKIPEGKRIKSFQVSSRLDDFDVIINLPKMKTHVLCGLTLGVKNLYGCISGKQKGKYHLRFQDAVSFSDLLLDLYSLIKPSLTILDAITAMEGQGPGSGDPIDIGLVIASPSALALDTVASKIAGFKEKEFPLLVAAQKRNFLEANLDNISIKGLDLGALNFKPFRRARKQRSLLWFVPFKKQLSRKLIAKPILTSDLCIKCQKCHEICPADAIVMTSAGPIFDYKKCIRCYCCHEICPKRAINLHEGTLARLINKIK